MWDWAPLLILALLAIGAVWVAGAWLRDERLRTLLVFGLILRLVGASLRLEIIQRAYGGAADAGVYFIWGSIYADSVVDLDFSFMFDGGPDGRWWGSQFIRSICGFVVLFSGYNIRAAFAIFALFAFVGLALCIVAFGRVFQRDEQYRYAAWILCWPALCFWPSSIGKEAMMVLAIGLMIYGYVGRERKNWVLLALGLLLATAIRPHVAGLLAAALFVAELLKPGSFMSPQRALSAIVALVIAIVTLSEGLERLGVVDIDLEGIQEQLEYRVEQTGRGGSRIEQVGGLLVIPMAFVNVLFRPFPWEARGLSILSSVEMVFLWLVVAIRWRSWLPALRDWRSNAFLRVSLPFAISLCLLYGMAFANLGIIARQRIVIFPFLLVLVATLRRSAVAESEPEPAAPRLAGAER